MHTATPSAAEDILERLDLSAIADPGDELRECEFFYGLASVEEGRERFRWLISAFLNAAYSFFESSALSAFVRITDHETGEPVQDSEAVEILQRYVKITQRKNKPYYVTTEGMHPITRQLYKFRAAATHHFPLSIMASGPALPEDFEFGSLRGEGTPALALCREALDLIREVEKEIEQ